MPRTWSVINPKAAFTTCRACKSSKTCVRDTCARGSLDLMAVPQGRGFGVAGRIDRHEIGTAPLHEDRVSA